MLLMVSASLEGKYRLSNCLRKFYSMNIWIPIAHLSYSVYIMHIPFALGWPIAYKWFPFPKKADGCWDPSQEISYWIVIFFVDGAFVFLMCRLFYYPLWEKPGIDVRAIYTNKYEKEYLLKKANDKRNAEGSPSETELVTEKMEVVKKSPSE